jgi:excisionase family DNA binding protein
MPNELNRHNPMTAGEARGSARRPDPDFLTVQELAGVLRIGRNQAYALVKTGRVVGHRFGGTIRVPRTAIQRLLDAPAGASDGEA